MWGNFPAINLKDLADKAKAAAEQLDKQLNESVGIETPAKEAAPQLDMDGLDDAWGDDDDLLVADDGVQETEVEAAVGDPELSLGENPSDVQEPVGLEPLDQGTVNNGWEDDALQLDEHLFDSAHSAGEKDTENAIRHQQPSPEAEAQETSLAAAELSDFPNNDEYNLESEQGTELTETEKSPLLETSPNNEQTATPAITLSLEEAKEQTFPVDSDRDSQVTEAYAGSTAHDLAKIEGHDEAPDVVHVASQNDRDVSATDEVFIGVNPTLDTDRLALESQPLGDSESMDQNIEQEPKENRDDVNHDTLQLREQLRRMEEQLQGVQMALRQREDQLISKTEQLTEMESMHEKEKEDLRQKIIETKDEARKRIQKAKERVEAAESQLQSFKAAKSSSEDDSSKQAEIIAELRAEGESLARKQADMEMALRTSKSEARSLKEALEDEITAKKKALSRIEQLEKDLIETSDNLAAARRGESLADKLEEDLRKAKEENERKGSLILSLEQQLKEIKAETRDLMTDLEAAKKGAAVESEQTVKRLRKEHADAIEEMEAKLHKSEKDAHTREDLLRREVDELRKRWQDAIRRADSLSMDIQSSTAPLLRQLESAERQNRARAAAASEIETKLRSELEDAILSKEKLAKERNDFKSRLNLLERSCKETEDELASTQLSLKEKNAMIKQLEDQLEKLEGELSQKQEHWREIERLANEGVARVRSEMTQTIVDSEERHRSQLESIQRELSQEREKRCQLEQQVSGLVENAAMLVPTNHETIMHQEVKPKKLKQSEGQLEILAGAMGGLGRSPDDDDESGPDDGMLEQTDEHAIPIGSFAALAEMQSRMKAMKQELEDLRRSLRESEKAKERLVIDLRDSRNAKERLPLFESRCQELTDENRRLEMEVNVLTEEMEEMRLLYRSQLEAYMLASGGADHSGSLSLDQGAGDRVQTDGEPPSTLEGEIDATA